MRLRDRALLIVVTWLMLWLMLWGTRFFDVPLNSEKFIFHLFDCTAGFSACSPTPPTTAPAALIRVGHLEAPAWHPKETEIVRNRLAESVIVSVASVNSDNLFPRPKAHILDFWQNPRDSFFDLIGGTFFNLLVRYVYFDRITNGNFLGQGFPLDGRIKTGYCPNQRTSIDDQKSQFLGSSIPSWTVADNNNSGHCSNQLLSHQSSLLLNLAERVMGSISRFLIRVVDFDRIGGIDAENHKPKDLQNTFAVIEPISLFLVGFTALSVGWWKLRFCDSGRDLLYGTIGLFLGFPVTVWSILVFTDRFCH